MADRFEVLPPGKYKLSQVQVESDKIINFSSPFVILRTRFVTRPDCAVLDVLTLERSEKKCPPKKN
jgi:hypothetical protein